MRPINKILIATFMIAGFNVGCSEEPETVLEQPSTDDTNIVDGVPESSPLYLKLGVQWESADEKAGFERMGNCAFDADSPLESTLNCNISVPEGQLYYSNVNFDIGTLSPEKCPIISFRPYYYLRSNTAGFTPPGDTTVVDCSLQSDPKCYGGAAPTLIPEFPKNTGLYFLTFVSQNASFKLPSENKTRWYGTDERVNYLVTNNLTAFETPVGAGPRQRVGRPDPLNDPQTWFGYEIKCTTHWGRELYTIKLTIRDENEENNDPLGGDEYTDWF
ncbi:hypothetical protein [Bdellovibrio sp. BCCA]|uniref:hypothetical protein n=1 Tax=Bdellovibrio sp. BCCA TaxID=3136281 RepID=UPI0030EFED50